MYMREPFAKQINRVQAISRKLLEDKHDGACPAWNILQRYRLRAQLSCSVALTRSRSRASLRRHRGPLEPHKVGTRAAAQGLVPHRTGGRCRLQKII